MALTGADTGVEEALSLELAFSLLDTVAWTQPVPVTLYVTFAPPSGKAEVSPRCIKCGQVSCLGSE